MTTGSQQTNSRRWLLPFLAALIAALAAILLGTTASASATVGAETRVGAFNVAGEVLVEPPQGESPGQRLGKDVPQAKIVVATGVAAKTGRNFDNYGGEFLDDAVRSPVVRPDVPGMSSKIQRQMGTRGWTPGLIDEAVLQGRAFPAVNKLGGANTPATRYVHPRTGQSVVIDNATGEIIQVGGPGFRY